MTKIKSKKAIWLTWHYAARSRNMAKELNIPVLEYFNNKNLISRHGLSSLWTIKTLLKEKPDVIFIQLSFMLLNIVAFYKLITFRNIVIVADCHTKALRRKAKGIFNFIFWPLKKLTFRLVDISIVSNIGMEKDIKQLHDNYFLIPDKIPELSIDKDENKKQNYFVYISSFAVDEPFDEIFKVAEILGNSHTIYWTGKIPANIQLPENIPENLKFTDYISFEEYYNLIANADAVLALTTEDDCLQSGAYEALAVKTPMVISNSKALQIYFGSSAIYTSHEPQEIAENLIKAKSSYSEMVVNSSEIKELRDLEFNSLISELIDEVNLKLEN